MKTIKQVSDKHLHNMKILLDHPYIMDDELKGFRDYSSDLLNGLVVQFKWSSKEFTEFSFWFRGAHVLDIFYDLRHDGVTWVYHTPVGAKKMRIFEYKTFIPNDVFTEKELAEAIDKCLSQMWKKFSVRNPMYLAEKELASQEVVKQREIKTTRSKRSIKNFLKWGRE